MATSEQLALGLWEEENANERPISSLATILRGRGPVYESGSGRLAVNQKCVRWEGIDLLHAKEVSEAWVKTLPSSYWLREHDVVVNSTGEGTIGRTCVVGPDAAGLPFDSHILAVRPNDREMLPAYLAYYLRSPDGQAAVEDAKGAKTTKQTELGVAKLGNINMPVPPLHEQRRIVARIEELATRIERARGLRREAAEDIKAITLVAQTEVFGNPSKNETLRLDDIALLERGKFSHRPRNDRRFYGGDHPWIQIAEIEASNRYIREWTQTLNDAGLAISRKFPKGTVLVSIAATIGAVGILDFDCCIPDSIVAITPRRGVDGDYIYHYLCYARSNLEYIAPQSAQKNINLNILGPLPVPDLSLVEQRRIVAYLNDMEAKADALKRVQAESAAELDALLPAVLARAFQGEL